MALKKGYRDLLNEAYAEVETVPVEAAIGLLDTPGVTFVDIRDVRELQRTGIIPGALHAPRGMLEFWVDPESPYHKEAFANGGRYLLYCASAWRSALACKTLQEMGLDVAHVEGGFSKWREAGGPVIEAEKQWG